MLIVVYMHINSTFNNAPYYGKVTIALTSDSA